MTLTAPKFPLSEAEALTHLKDALGSNYGGATDNATLTRALSVDGVTVGADFHARPWATAARLIRENTEYEVASGLVGQINRKLRGLDAQQRQMDLLAGIYHLLPRVEDDWQGQSGSVENVSVF